MVVISDTSIITNLIQLDQLLLLKDLFAEIVIPEKVKEELSKVEGQSRIIEDKGWITVRSITNQELYDKIDLELDPGEAESIVLAIELEADVLLIDEKKGRRIAEKYGLRITGLLGMLLVAKERALIDRVKPVLDKLIYEIGFRINPKLYQEILKRANE